MEISPTQSDTRMLQWSERDETKVGATPVGIKQIQFKRTRKVMLCTVLDLDVQSFRCSPCWFITRQVFYPQPH